MEGFLLGLLMKEMDTRHLYCSESMAANKKDLWPIFHPSLMPWLQGRVKADPDLDSALQRTKKNPAHTTLCASSLPSPLSAAELPELMALNEACKLAENKCANVYADIHYAHGAVHGFVTLETLPLENP